MKRFIIMPLLALCCMASAWAADDQKWVDAASLNIVGKIMATSKPYQRIDTAVYDGFTDYEARLAQMSAGLKIAFKTNSRTLSVKPFYTLTQGGSNNTGINQYGYTLYIKKDGRWIYANSVATFETGKAKELMKDMPSGEKECLLYMPSLTIVDSLALGVDANASIEKLDNPFRKRIAVFGSSYTHGVSTDRPGMSYAQILERNTGFYFMNLGMSGHSMLQQSFARVLADAQLDALVCDAFSNPSAEQIEERFDAFVKTIRAKHPTMPIIFMQTIYRERRNFNEGYDRYEQAKMDAAEKVVRRAMQTDKNIYWIVPSTGTDHETSVDGIHPGAIGYAQWAASIEKPILKILAKYGVK